MKKYLNTRSRVAVAVVAGTLGTAMLAVPHMADAQDASDKIGLMAEALRARDSGDLSTARKKTEELIKIAPDDENIQRLLASINKDIERQSQGAEIYGQAADEAASTPESLAAAVAADQEAKVAAAENAIDEANQLAELGAYEDAAALLSRASGSLTLNTATAGTLEAIAAAEAAIILTEAEALAESGDDRGAELLIEDYLAAGGDAATARQLARSLDAKISNPYALDIKDVSPEYVDQSKIIRDLLTRGRAQFLNGDYDGAAKTFKEVEARDANNAEAKLFSTRIAQVLGKVHKQNLYKTREQMLTEVDQQWERPKVFDITAGPVDQGAGPSVVQQKLNQIVIPQVNFSGMELTRVIETLSELSVEYDNESQGVNIVPLFNPNEDNPRVNISLRSLSLDRILQFVTQQVNFTYEVGADAVTVAPSFGPAGGQSTVTEFFPITAGTVIRLTGFGDSGASSAVVDPFAPAAATSGPSSDDKTDALQAFFQRAGVNFEIPGASLAFDGEQLIATQTRQNLDRMRTILRNYSEVKQVEIEAKFLEVAQGDLEELGFDWGVTRYSTTNDPLFFGTPERVTEQMLPRIQGADPGGSLSYSDIDLITQNIYRKSDGSTTDDINDPDVIGFAAMQDVVGGNIESKDIYGRTDLSGRSLNDAFSVSRESSAITINGKAAGSSGPPIIPTAVDIATAATNLFTHSWTPARGLDIDLSIRALARKTGSDLMSAPKVTVLSGKRATITVAQELRYPESYGDIEARASESSGSATGNGGGNGSVAITAGTPEDFVTRNVGVELAVTPNVENDDTISLTLEPRVTEFEGFVEYGGPSVAIAGNTTVSVPAGFYQPIFSTREISTEVTIFDGATLVMGGLTRDEVKTVSDKVPVLGDIPGVGRLFRSEGETRQKRNLLIFVTANLVSPGGSLSRQSYQNAKANSLFQNPTIMTPSGAVNRSVSDDKK